MLWSTRKQYYLGFWAFLEFKSVNILIKTGLYFRHSVDILSTCYVYENRRKWIRSQTCENIAGKFEIRFYFIFLFWWSTLTNYWKHFPQSICIEFISPVGLFLYNNEKIINPWLQGKCLYLLCHTADRCWTGGGLFCNGSGFWYGYEMNLLILTRFQTDYFLILWSSCIKDMMTNKTWLDNFVGLSDKSMSRHVNQLCPHMWKPKVTWHFSLATIMWKGQIWWGFVGINCKQKDKLDACPF